MFEIFAAIREKIFDLLFVMSEFSVNDIGVYKPVARRDFIQFRFIPP